MLFLCVQHNVKHHTIVEESVIPFAVQIASQIKAIPCSDNNVQRRTAAGVTNKVVEKIVEAKQFTLEMDESTDISNET